TPAHAEKTPARAPDRSPSHEKTAPRTPDKPKDAHTKSTKSAPNTKSNASQLASRITHKNVPQHAPTHAATSKPKKKPTTYGLLAIEANPDAVVAIDGRIVGYTPLLHVKLPVGRHDVALMKPYTRVLRWRKTVTVYESKKHRISLQ